MAEVLTDAQQLSKIKTWAYTVLVFAAGFWVLMPKDEV